MPDQRPMPKMTKPPGELAERFASVMAARPEATTRLMFGQPAAFVNGNMATGLFATGWFVRLADADTAELTAAGGGPFEPMAGRPMRGYTMLPPEIAADAEVAGAWVDRAIVHVQGLPPKR
jgi:TfoX/Sxy family transcriptional regulator of competence genes